AVVRAARRPCPLRGAGREHGIAEVFARAVADVGDGLTIGRLEQVVTTRFGARELAANVDLVGLEDREALRVGGRGIGGDARSRGALRCGRGVTVGFAVSFALSRHDTPLVTSSGTSDRTRPASGAAQWVVVSV